MPLPFSDQRLPGAWALLVCTLASAGCLAPQIGGPTAPRGDPAAGTLTLPSGRTVHVYPQDLAYTGRARYGWPDGRAYEGDWVAGTPHGMGTETTTTGATYRGTWRSGVRDGHGELSDAEGRRYVGDFARGLRNGEGAQHSREGLYRGTWRDDLPEGRGDFFAADGSIYRGNWSRGVREGHGTLEATNGSRYDGDWAQDAPNGFGRLDSFDGSVYVGHWRGNLRWGYGRLDTPAGISYEGTWRDGRRHGYGTTDGPTGRRYEGEWHEGQRSGRGRESYPDGSHHDGTWELNQVLGPGTRHSRLSVEISGLWNGDNVTNGLLRLPSGAEYAGSLFRRRSREVAPGLVGWLQAQADGGDPVAHYLLGTVYSDYDRPAPDTARAQQHFTSAAEAGVAEARYRLALLRLENTPEEAVRLLAAAAAQGQPEASALLGEFFAAGTHVPRDTSAAITYLHQASQRGNVGARNNLAWILATYPDSLLRDGDRALALIRPLALLYEDWQHLDTLAAAYAETGEFDKAAEAQEKALALADEDAALAPDADERNHMQARLVLYRAQKPFREGEPGDRPAIQLQTDGQGGRE